MEFTQGKLLLHELPTHTELYSPEHPVLVEPTGHGEHGTQLPADVPVAVHPTRYCPVLQPPHGAHLAFWVDEQAKIYSPNAQVGTVQGLHTG